RDGEGVRQIARGACREPREGRGRLAPAARSGTRATARAAVHQRRQARLCGLHPAEPAAMDPHRQSASDSRGRRCAPCLARAHARSLRRPRADRARTRMTIRWTETLRDCVARLAHERPAQTAVVGTGAALSYGELHARALALAAGFRALDLGPG